jgi:high affinity choline transporter 7
VAGMFAFFLVVGWLASCRVAQATADELILAGRSMPLWIATMTMTATWVDGGYLLGTAEGVFKPGGGLASGLQGGVCFGLSLMLGGLFFARKMRAYEFTTLELRFGKTWAAVLLLPALAGEVIWGAELLVAIGATFSVLLNVELVPSVLTAAAVVTLYTVLGGLWSVAWTDAFQLALVPLGMLAALFPVLYAVGGLEPTLETYAELQASRPAWTLPQAVNWWDVSLMLMLGGIPWNCYFQRVLACRTPLTARWHSFTSGALTILLTLPPLLLGLAALRYPWTPAQRAALEADPSSVLPFLLRHATPGAVGLLGLAAIVGAVTSSYSASVLSAGSLLTWNVYRPLFDSEPSPVRMRRMLRGAILLLSGLAVLLALRSKSVQGLWFFTADLIFVLLMPQLTFALFDPRCNRCGSCTAFAVSLLLRLGGGEPTLGLRPLVDYPALLAPLLPETPSAWYEVQDGANVQLFPFRTLAFVAGVVLLPLVSRLTARWDPPCPLPKPPEIMTLEDPALV